MCLMFLMCLPVTLVVMSELLFVRCKTCKTWGWRGVQWQCGCVVAVDQSENFNG